MWRRVHGRSAGPAGLFGAWVHASVAGDAMLSARHAALIGSHVMGGSIAAVVFAAYFALGGAPGVATLIAAWCFLTPLGIASLLSRNGRLDLAHLLCALQFTAVIALAAALSGGTASFAIAWLALVPLESALSGSPRITVMATGLALATAVGLGVATEVGMIPTPVDLPLRAASLAMAVKLGGIAYAGSVAASVVRLQLSAYREVAASRERFRLIADSANDLITCHGTDGQISFASLASSAIVGLEPGSLARQGFGAVLQEADQQRYVASLQRCRDTRQQVCEEYLLRRSLEAGGDPPDRWIEMRCQPMARQARPPTSARAWDGDEAGAGAVIAVTRDVTQRKAEAMELHRAREEAERAGRAKRSFLAVMSHELRTPLSSIIGFAELLHGELLSKGREPRYVEYCRVIHQSGEHLLSLVKDLLDVSKIESGKLSIAPEPFSLAELARDVAQTMRPQTDAKRIALTVEIEPRLPHLMADHRATRQILINLVANALKFTPPDGRVMILARRAATRIEIEVRDTGAGIEREHLARLGEAFYQVESGYARHNDGAGLGLSIVRGLADLHGGSLRVESDPGQGSRFVVSLPAHIEPAGSTEAASSTAGAKVASVPAGPGERPAEVAKP